MSGPLNFEPPTPLAYFETLVADDASLSLLEAAAAVAQIEDPGLDVQATLSQVDALAQALVQRLPADAAAIARLRVLNRYFFHELGFAGNANDYYDPRNSHLHEVLRTRRGIPITLALLYVELATAIGLDAAGVSFPGHFLVRVHLSSGDVVMDPFSGQSLSREALDERLVPFLGALRAGQPREVPLAPFLQPAGKRETLARLLRNLKEIHLSAHDWPRLLAVQERLVVLLPTAWEERRDRGLAHAELGAVDAAATDLAAYLNARPHAHDAAALGQRLAELRAGGPRWH